jgi:hypothetical protein
MLAAHKLKEIKIYMCMNMSQWNPLKCHFKKQSTQKVLQDL